MNIEELDPDALWRYYQRGYHCLVRSGLYFRQLLRPALSHVYFHRAVPLLQQYARANRGDEDLPPGFGDQLEACPLTPRDLLHLDYAICLGYAEAQGNDSRLLSLLPVLDWPGPVGHSGLFIAADAIMAPDGEVVTETYDEFEDEEEDDEDGMDEEGDEDGDTPFDL